ncbi:hypothetical protein ACOMHN_049411 [Nucella lapillus]
MAASGINEHKEGCRKQRVLDRASNARKMLGDNAPKDYAMPMAVDDSEAPGYMRKMGSPPGITGNALPGTYCMDNQAAVCGDTFSSHSPTAIDKLRRQGVRAQQLIAYSAKIPDRLSSVNYTQQW